MGSLAVTYFRERMLTIIGAHLFHGPVRDGKEWYIGAESFHCPVRDGKEWYQLAMVIRRFPVTILTFSYAT